MNGISPSQQKQVDVRKLDLCSRRATKLERAKTPMANDDNVTSRIVDLIVSIGKGQRALLVAPPKSGKTVMMKKPGACPHGKPPDVHLIVLLVTNARKK